MQVGNPAKSNAEYLAGIMAGAYAAKPADVNAASGIAADLPYLTNISPRDIAPFASANQSPVHQVRNTYHIALANALRAEIMVTPALEERYRNVQVLLSLFLEENDNSDGLSSCEAIHSKMTPTTAVTIAAEYSLPVSFVEFLIMDDDLDDGPWKEINSFRNDAASSCLVYAEMYLNGEYWGLYGIQDRIDRKQAAGDKRSGILYKVTANNRPTVEELLACESNDVCRGFQLEFSGANGVYP